MLLNFIGCWLTRRINFELDYERRVSDGFTIEHLAKVSGFARVQSRALYCEEYLTVEQFELKKGKRI